MKATVRFIVMSAILLGFVNCQNKKVEMPNQSYGLRTVYFDYDKSFIRSDSAAILQGNAAYLKQNANVSVIIEGHCDNRGSNEYNLALGQRRAQSSKDYLVNLGVSSSRMRTVSYGEEKPVCYQNAEECWQKNRRADFRK